MVPKLIDFIERNIGWIEERNYAKVYANAWQDIPEQTGNLTTNLISAGVNPLENTTELFPGMFSNSRITEFEIPNNIKTVYGKAFYDCYELTKITIPESIEWIHDSAFKGCYELKDIVYKGTVKQFESLKLSYILFNDCLAEYVQCSDGRYKILWHN